VKYYFIDFGLSKIYPSDFDGPPPLERGPRGHIIAPEMLTGRLYDPMLADIYALGSLFETVLEEYRGWDNKEFSSWIKSLKDKNPVSRPSAEEALQDCEEFIKTIPQIELRKRITPSFHIKERFPPLTDLYYTLRAVYSGTDVMETELYEGIDIPSKDGASTQNKSIPSRLLSVLRHFV